MGYWDTPGKSDEWYTPKYVFDAFDTTFDVDVASPKDYTTFVPANRFITEKSLEIEWEGFVYMNPPFGGRNGIIPWLEKFFNHGNGIALVPDRTSAPWFHQYSVKADLVMFTRKIQFIRPDGTKGKSPSNGTAFLAVGHKGVVTLENAHRNGLGILVKPVDIKWH